MKYIHKVVLVFKSTKSRIIPMVEVIDKQQDLSVDFNIDKLDPKLKEKLNELLADLEKRFILSVKVVKGFSTNNYPTQLKFARYAKNSLSCNVNYLELKMLSQDDCVKSVEFWYVFEG